MSVVVIGLSHRSAPVALRERFAFASHAIPGALQALRTSGLATEAAILSTCNRVEIYAATPLPPAEAFGEFKKFLVAHHAYGEALGDELYALAEPHSLHHLFKVASGLDSMVLGETEIFGQLKQAYEMASAHQHTGARLNRAFQRAFNVAKHIRTTTNIQRGSVSVMSAAVELAEKIFSSLADHEVLVSAVSLWEAAIKVRVGKLAVDIPALTTGCVRAGFRIVELSPLHVARLMKLPLPGEHRDPFDHLLLAQAAAEGAQFVTADARLAGFGVALLPAA